MPKRCANALHALGLASDLTTPDPYSASVQLLDQGADVHDVNPVPQELCADNQGSALHEAAYNGHLVSGLARQETNTEGFLFQCLQQMKGCG